MIDDPEQQRRQGDARRVERHEGNEVEKGVASGAGLAATRDGDADRSPSPLRCQMAFSTAARFRWSAAFAVLAATAGWASFGLHRSQKADSEEKEEASYADQAVHWRNLSNRDETGQIAPGARLRALENRRINLEFRAAGM